MGILALYLDPWNLPHPTVPDWYFWPSQLKCYVLVLNVPIAKPAPLALISLLAFPNEWNGMGLANRFAVKKYARLCQIHCVNLNSLYDLILPFVKKKKKNTPVSICFCFYFVV